MSDVAGNIFICNEMTDIFRSVTTGSDRDPGRILWKERIFAEDSAGALIHVTVII